METVSLDAQIVSCREIKAKESGKKFAVIAGVTDIGIFEQLTDHSIYTKLEDVDLPENYELIFAPYTDQNKKVAFRLIDIK